MNCQVDNTISSINSTTTTTLGDGGGGGSTVIALDGIEKIR